MFPVFHKQNAISRKKMNHAFQENQKHIRENPHISPKEPSLKQSIAENLQPSFKFLSFATPNSKNSTSRLIRALSKKKPEVKNFDPSSKVRIVTHKLQEIPSNSRDEGFKCNALCVNLPVIGRTKAVKGRKEETGVNVVNPWPVSSENFERNSLQNRARENEGDNSVSSYFDLPSELFKCKNHGA